MKINKIVNNNIVTSFDENQCELVVMGRGLGFGKKPGEEISNEKIEKIFRLENATNNNKLADILSDIPMEHIQVADEIITHAKSVLGDRLQETIYLSLIDHIHCAIERFENDITYSNPFLWEIKQYYPVEFKVGVQSLVIIKDRLGLRFPVDEAGFITLHFITSEYGANMSISLDIPQFVDSILKIVDQSFGDKIIKDSIHYERFLTHVKFFAARILQEKQIPDDNDELFQKMIKEQYQESHQCALKIKEFLQKEYDITVGEEEMLYLTVHIQRICMK